MTRDALNLLWHNAVFGLAGRLRHPEAAVSLISQQKAVELYHHILGEDAQRPVTALGDAESKDGERPVTTSAGMDLMGWIDPHGVHLPQLINRYPDASLNRDLFYWLAAFFGSRQSLTGQQQLAVGVRHLLVGVAVSQRVTAQYPGLQARYSRLCAAELHQRRSLLPKLGHGTGRVHQLESAIRFALGGDDEPIDPWLREAMAQAQQGEVLSPPTPWSKRMTPFLPVPLWRRPERGTRGLRVPWIKRRLPYRLDEKRKKIDKPRKHRPDSAIANSSEDENVHLYNEWNHETGAYLQDWCRVVEHAPLPSEAQIAASADDSDRLLARQVRQRFEAFRQIRGWKRHLDSGEEVDIDAFVNSAADRLACGFSDTGLYRQRHFQERDLCVAVLMDLSRSTSERIGEHKVIDIARRSVAILADALEALGDDFALFGFSSDSRQRISCTGIKQFDESCDAEIHARLRCVKPGNYTRMGAPIRHIGEKLKTRMNRQKILLLLTDGKPYDPTDRYEGAYAIEDTRRALLEQRMHGVHCVGLTIESQGREHLPRLFGPGHYAVFSHPEALPSLLPALYARMTGLAG